MAGGRFFSMQYGAYLGQAIRRARLARHPCKGTVALVRAGRRVRRAERQALGELVHRDGGGSLKLLHLKQRALAPASAVALKVQTPAPL
jgi:hypothetical protein